MRSSFVDARAELCAKHYARVQRFVQRIGGLSRQDREDLVQDTFMMTCSVRVTIPDSPDEQLAWLCKNAVHLLQNHALRVAHRAEVRALEAPVAKRRAPPPDEAVNARDLLERVLPALSAEEQRHLQLHLFEGATLDELAPLLNITRGAVWSRTKRLRQDLRREISNQKSRVRPRR
jgi:RNA polymerase sigma factor (sigma-70 family)